MVAVFVTGTDTGCGKTFVSEYLIRGSGRLRAKGYRHEACCHGCDSRDWKNEDVVKLLLPQHLLQSIVY